MVMVYGMSDKLPNLNYIDSSGQDYGFQKPYSEETAKMIDDEVTRIVNEQYERAKNILREYAKQHNAIRDRLIEHEVIYHDDVENILGKRKWKSRTDEIMELNAEDQRRRELEKLNKKDSADENDSGEFDPDDDAGTPPEFLHPED